jgi:IS1 family transposase
MGKVYTEAQKLAKLRSDLATKALHTIKARYMGEYQEVYHNLLDEHGLQPTKKTQHTHLLWKENQKLRQMLKQMSAQGKVEVIEFEDDRSWNYPKPKEQEDDNE